MAMGRKVSLSRPAEEICTLRSVACCMRCIAAAMGSLSDDLGAEARRCRPHGLFDLGSNLASGQTQMCLHRATPLNFNKLASHKTTSPHGCPARRNGPASLVFFFSSPPPLPPGPDPSSQRSTSMIGRWHYMQRPIQLQVLPQTFDNR